MEQDFSTAETALLDGIRRGDRDAVAAMLDDDFVITTAGWLAEPAGRAAWLEGLAEHDLEEFDVRILAVRSYADASVVLVESRQRGRRFGDRWEHLFRYTDVWVTRQGAARLAVRHASIVRPS